MCRPPDPAAAYAACLRTQGPAQGQMGKSFCFFFQKEALTSLQIESIGFFEKKHQKTFTHLVQVGC
jgi:hypothetical protein